MKKFFVWWHYALSLYICTLLSYSFSILFSLSLSLCVYLSLFCLWMWVHQFLVFSHCPSLFISLCLHLFSLSLCLHLCKYSSLILSVSAYLSHSLVPPNIIFPHLSLSLSQLLITPEITDITIHLIFYLKDSLSWNDQFLKHTGSLSTEISNFYQELIKCFPDLENCDCRLNKSWKTR